jgi:hypothetical protein
MNDVMTQRAMRRSGRSVRAQDTIAGGKYLPMRNGHDESEPDPALTRDWRSLQPNQRDADGTILR